jgi:acyl carrier protein
MQKGEIQSQVITLILDMTQDWDLDSDMEIGPGTALMGDLSFESIDMVQLAVALEQSFDKKGLPFEQLFMREGDYVDELYVSEVVDFISTHVA